VTKFSTLAYSVLLIALVASHAPTEAQGAARLCSDIFQPTALTRLFDSGSQTSLRAENKFTQDHVRFFQTEHPTPRVMRALEALRRDWKIELRRSLDPETQKENSGFTPWLIGATIDLPRGALKSDEALAAYLEHLIPLAREAKRLALREQNEAAVEKLDAPTKALLTKWFTLNDVRVFVKATTNLGESFGNTITIDQSIVRYPRVIGTVAHEIYHTTVTSKLNERATPLEIGRAMWFSIRESRLPGDYARLHRADEYEARLKQTAILRFHKHVSDAAAVQEAALLFKREQRQALEEFLTRFEQTEITPSEDPGDRKRPALKLTLSGTTAYIPLVKDVDDVRAYAHAVLARRFKTFVSN
jgi:hypothetical protein